LSLIATAAVVDVAATTAAVAEEEVEVRSPHQTWQLFSSFRPPHTSHVYFTQVATTIAIIAEDAAATTEDAAEEEVSSMLLAANTLGFGKF